MHPANHFAASAVIAAIAWPFFGAYSLLIFVGGVLIDIDHYITYAFRHKDLNPIKAYRYFRLLGKNIRSCRNLPITKIEEIFIFHNVEFITILCALSFFSPEVFLITIGAVVHIALDLYNELAYLRCAKRYVLLHELPKKQEALK